MAKENENPAFDLPWVKETGLRELHPLDGALLLMHFAFRGLIVNADIFLQEHGLSRVHHRVLYVIARTDGVSVGALQGILGVSKQALHKPLKQLQEDGYVVAERHPEEHRMKILRLTAKGSRMERAASDFERKAIERALGTVNKEQQRVWTTVMAALARLA